MKKIICAVFSLLVLFSCSTIDINRTDSENNIYVNQVGYLTNQNKYFIVGSTKGKFEIRSVKDDTVVYTGKAKLWQEEDKPSGLTLSKGDFSDFNQDGDYYIVMKNANRSYNFTIGSDIYNEVRDITIKSFFYQRSGIELLEEHVGEFKRAAGHVENLKYHPSSPIKGDKDVSGGWYDAGDFGRYITPGSVSLGLMMMGYEQFPSKFNFDNNNIPESGNGVSDYLDELRFELEWMHKMQHRDKDEYRGALPYMVNSKGYVWSMPDKGGEQYIYEFSSISTATFAAVNAMAYRIFKDVDSTFANLCLERAELAWEFVERMGTYPKDGFVRPSDTTTGGYADNPNRNYDDFDDRLWASVELYLSTGRDKYHEEAVSKLNKVATFKGTMTWANTMGFGIMQYVLADKEVVKTELQDKLKGFFFDHANSLVDQVNSDGFKSALSQYQYVWGSNGELLTKAELLIFAHILSDDNKYYDAALAQLNYTLGLNVNNISYVTSLGTKYPMNIHHATMMNDGIEKPFPGFLTGGPNFNIYDDHTLNQYFTEDTPTATCYIDHVDSWASNENCILYSAPLTPVAAYFSN